MDKNILWVILGFSMILTVFSSASCSSVQEESPGTLPQIISPDNPKIRYTGRIDFSKPLSPAFSFPGVQIDISFQGQNLIFTAGDEGQKQDFLAVIIDGKPAGKIGLKSGKNTYTAAKNLEPGVHRVQLFKLTEAMCGKVTFFGFSLDSESALRDLPPRLSRSLEFIGDSLTCGYGNELSVADPQNYHFTPENENNYLAWGAVASRTLAAEYQAVCYSGRGMFRNFDGIEQGTAPEFFPRIFPDDKESPLWGFTGYRPDIIFINLGANDYNSQLVKKDLPPEAFDMKFKDKYRTFLKLIREKYGPSPHIVLVVPPMSDIYPPGLNSLTRERKVLAGLREEFSNSGDKEIWIMETPQFGGTLWGEDWHPTIAAHKIMAEGAVEFIKKNFGW